MKHTQTKFFIMFLAGILFSAITVFAATISVNTDFGGNAVQYLQKLVLTNEFGSTGLILDANANPASLENKLIVNGHGLIGMNFTVSGNVGIAGVMPNPLFPLNVDGTGKFTNGVIASSFCDSNGTTCSRVSDMIGGDSIWNTGISSSINYMNGNVGIGTDSPTAKLDVDGTTILRDQVYANAIKASNHVGNDLILQGGNGIVGWPTYTGGDIILKGGAEGPVYGNIILAPGTDKVGIGTDSPQAKLDVHGTTIILGDTTTKIISDIDDARPKIRGIQNGAEKWLLGSYDTFGEQNLSLYTIDTGELHLGTNNQSTLVIDGSGNVGIGVETPSTKLEVAGMLTVQGYPTTINPCDGSNEGAIFYDSTTKYHCVCDLGGSAHRLDDYNAQCR